MYSIVLKEKSC